MTEQNEVEKLITVCLSYYNQPEVMVDQLKWWLEYSGDVKKRMSFFIIDDCSTRGALDVIKDVGLYERLGELSITIFRVKEDKFCNISGVRNLGATECITPYMVILDMDTFISNNTMEKMIAVAESNIDKKIAFIFNRRVESNPSHKKHNKLHPAVSLIRVKDYWDVGGCDEDYVGNYGYTDPTFWWRAKNLIEKHECRNIYLDYKDEGECDMVRDTRKNKRLFEKKMADGSWSSDFIRFEYIKEYYAPMGGSM